MYVVAHLKAYSDTHTNTHTHTHTTHTLQYKYTAKTTYLQKPYPIHIPMETDMFL